MKSSDGHGDVGLSRPAERGVDTPLPVDLTDARRDLESRGAGLRCQGAKPTLSTYQVLLASPDSSWMANL